jgi:hypothetical protein
MSKVSYSPGDKIKVISLPKSGVTLYTIGQTYTLKQKSYENGKFRGWLTQENSFWVIKENNIEKI